MTLVLELPAETEQLLREAAARAGREVEQFVLEAATEKLLTLDEVDAHTGSYAGHAKDLIELGLLDFRTVDGHKFVSRSDLARYENNLHTNPEGRWTRWWGLTSCGAFTTNEACRAS